MRVIYQYLQHGQRDKSVSCANDVTEMIERDMGGFRPMSTTQKQ